MFARLCLCPTTEPGLGLGEDTEALPFDAKFKVVSGNSVIKKNNIKCNILKIKINTKIL